jgi:predicted nucleic-acid-binding protein
LIESLEDDHPGFVTLVSILELYWVLTACYGLTNDQVKQALDVLLRTRQIIVDRAEQILRALRVFETGKANFADCLIERTASSVGCEQTLTFDVNAAKYAGMTLIV